MKIYPPHPPKKKKKPYKMKGQIIVDKEPHRYVIDSWVKLLRKYCIINLFVIPAEQKKIICHEKKGLLKSIHSPKLMINEHAFFLFSNDLMWKVKKVCFTVKILFLILTIYIIWIFFLLDF